MSKTRSIELPEIIYKRLEKLATIKEQDTVEYVISLISSAEAQLNWREALDLFYATTQKHGTPFDGMSKDEIAVKLRETRKEVFETEYAHLYR